MSQHTLGEKKIKTNFIAVERESQVEQGGPDDISFDEGRWHAGAYLSSLLGGGRGGGGGLLFKKCRVKYATLC